ncbi:MULTISPECIES: hypothetical protein [unclassified Crossiella]|uniref:hypothetical protein n=1 Tax=unclassified Crossiella TaxID=2620835 RepID=UPI001FFF6C11|nr:MULTISPECIES: hypothetical protein [unclassified Crossiella]MCK2240965.1 hypothetical protein [Crossiella sp. S99.2]MCK2253891.1 hypothetical protein [Crossiella sp. S99.1]
MDGTAQPTNGRRINAVLTGVGREAPNYAEAVRELVISVLTGQQLAELDTADGTLYTTPVPAAGARW